MIAQGEFYGLNPGEVIVGSDGWRLVMKYVFDEKHPHRPTIFHEEGDLDDILELRYFNGKIVDGEYGAFHVLNSPGAYKVTAEGKLSDGHKWMISPSRKKSPGLAEGNHLVLTLEGDPMIEQLGLSLWIEVLAVAHRFAMEQTASTAFNFRIAYSGSGASTRKHAHLHIILPQGDDKLPSLVER